ncbi:MAG: tRNA pseudouridine(38-40) synthase TruA [Clostridia bacterium]|nr:tRNA pseudouridine(38-40) synthase TruA [Clostridia bacterium]
MRNIKLVIQYDGSRYHGWQKQPNAATIQETVENAIHNITAEEITLYGCGRTDAGVHAKGYVCNFFTESRFDASRFKYAINSRLPDDIVCTLSEEADNSFDSRWSTSKTYSYLILNSEFPDVFLNKRAWHYCHPLDLDAMQKAAEYFTGEHDFIGFASSGFTVKTTVRTIYSIGVTKEGDIIRIDVTGNGFLYNMVRIIAGTLVFCGCGKIDWREMPDIIASLDRKRAGITAPADGLYLSEVFY